MLHLFDLFVTLQSPLVKCTTTSARLDGKLNTALTRNMSGLLNMFLNNLSQSSVMEVHMSTMMRRAVDYSVFLAYAFSKCC